MRPYKKSVKNAIAICLLFFLTAGVTLFAEERKFYFGEGSKDGFVKVTTHTTIRSESRRLMLQNIETAAGNSTVTDQDHEPWCGWGQMLPRFLNEGVVVANYAESGEAGNTFISSGRFDKILTQIKGGDYLFIEFGHNDQKQKGPDRGPYTSYKQSLKQMIVGTRAKGATPVLVTPMHRRRFDETGKIINTLGDYPDAVRQLAAEEHTGEQIAIKSVYCGGI